MAPVLLLLVDFLSLAAAVVLLHPTKNCVPDQMYVLNLNSLEKKMFVLNSLCGEQRLASTDAKSTRPKLPIFQMLSLSCSEFVFQLLYLTGSKKAIPTLAYQKKILKPPNKCAILKINAYSKSSLTTSISIVRLMNITPPYQTLPKANMFSIFNHFGRFFGSLTGL